MYLRSSRHTAIVAALDRTPRGRLAPLPCANSHSLRCSPTRLAAKEGGTLPPSLASLPPLARSKTSGFHARLAAFAAVGEGLFSPPPILPRRRRSMLRIALRRIIKDAKKAARLPRAAFNPRHGHRHSWLYRERTLSAQSASSNTHSALFSKTQNLARKRAVSATYSTSLP
jgi:hypothetical protein